MARWACHTLRSAAWRTRARGLRHAILCRCRRERAWTWHGSRVPETPKSSLSITSVNTLTSLTSVSLNSSDQVPCCPDSPVPDPPVSGPPVPVPAEGKPVTSAVVCSWSWRFSALLCGGNAQRRVQDPLQQSDNADFCRPSRARLQTRAELRLL